MIKEKNKLILAAALYYAGLNFSVIPVGTDKRPLIPWKKYQQEKASVEKIKKWFTQEFPNANVGVVTGKISGIVVVDVEAGGPTNNLPPTVISKTGGDGWHFFYKHPDVLVKNSTRIKELTDIRGDGGYVVMPPSIHSSGKRYEWSVGPDQANFMELPKWVLENSSNEEPKTENDWDKFLNSEVAEGNRNSTATKIAGKLLHDLPYELWELSGWTTLKEWNLKNSKPPLSERELKSVWESIKKAEIISIKKPTTKSDKNQFQELDKILAGVPKDVEKHLLPQLLNPLFSKLVLLDNTSINFYLKHKIKNYFGLTNEDTKSLEKSIKELKRKHSIEKSKKKEVTEEKLTEEEIKIAKEMLDNPSLLNKILETIKKLGIVGEENNCLLIYLAISSRILKKPLSVIVKGQSASGKSYPVQKIIQLFPKSAYIDITDATAQSFYYVEKDYFKNKIIIIFERHGSQKSDYAIRSFQSEEKLKIQVTVKDPITGEFKTDFKEVEGPVGFITTTTNSTIHDENETRNLSIYTDESTGQTNRIIDQQCESYDFRNQGLNSKDLEKQIILQKFLAKEKKLRVVIPYAKALMKNLPKNNVRIRRDSQKILALIEITTCLYQRQRHIDEKKEYIISSLADFYIIKIIFEEIIKKTLSEMPDRTIKIIKKAEELTEASDDSESFTFSRQELARELEWDKKLIEKWISPAENQNFLIIVEGGKGKNPYRYKFNSDKKIQDKEILPSVEKIIAQNPNLPKECIPRELYNPITGEIISINKKEIVEKYKNKQNNNK